MTVNKLQGLKLLILDVDGVLTDGSVIYNDKGEETKVFGVRDGLGNQGFRRTRRPRH